MHESLKMGWGRRSNYRSPIWHEGRGLHDSFVKQLIKQRRKVRKKFPTIYTSAVHTTHNRCIHITYIHQL